MPTGRRKEGFRDRDRRESSEDDVPAAGDEDERGAERTEDSRKVSHGVTNSNALTAVAPDRDIHPR